MDASQVRRQRRIAGLAALWLLGGSLLAGSAEAGIGRRFFRGRTAYPTYSRPYTYPARPTWTTQPGRYYAAPGTGGYASPVPSGYSVPAAPMYHPVPLAPNQRYFPPMIGG